MKLLEARGYRSFNTQPLSLCLPCNVLPEDHVEYETEFLVMMKSSGRHARALDVACGFIFPFSLFL